MPLFIQTDPERARLRWCASLDQSQQRACTTKSAHIHCKKRELLARDASEESIKLVEARITMRMKQLNDRVRQVSERAK